MAAGSSVASDFIRIGDTSGSNPATLALTAPGGQTVSTKINVRAATGLKSIRAANTSGTTTLSGNIFLDGDLTVTSENAGATLTLSGTSIDLKARTLTVSGTGTTNITGNLQNPTVTDLGKLNKTGTGVLLLSGTNTYRGATTINGGTVLLSADSNLGTAPGTAGTTAATANIQFGGGALRPTSSFTLGSTRTLGFLTGSGTIDVPTGVTLTVNGRLEGTTGYNKTGSGTVQLTNLSSTVTGPVSVTGGVLELSTSGRIGGTGVGSGDVTLNGGTLRNNEPTSGNSLLTANRSLLIGASGGTFDAPTSGVALIYSGTISGAGNTITKIGSGEMRVQGANTANYTFSKLVVLNGRYQIGSVLSGTIQTSTESGFGAVPGSFLADAITLNGGTVGTSFNTTLAANRGITLGASGGTINAANGSMVVPGRVSDAVGAGSLTLHGTSVNHLFTLSNTANEIAAGISIRGGRLIAGATGATGTGNITIDLGTNGGGLSNNVATLVEVNNPLITLGGTGNTPDIGATSVNTLQINSKITGARPFQKTSNTGSGTLTLTNSANDFTGNVTLSSGQIAVTANNALGTTAGSINVQASTSLVFRGNVNYTTAEPVFITGTGTTPSPGAVNSPSGGNLFGGPITLTGTSSVNVDAGSTLTLTGALATQSSFYFFSKSGGGTLALQGDSSGFNATGFNINGGTLSLTNTSGSATGSTPIIVKTGATLSGTGSTTAAVSIDANATLSPGLSIGDLDTGLLTFADSTSKYLVEINADAPAVDRTVVTGGVVLNGATLQLSFVTITPGIHATPQTFVLIDNDAADLVSGTFGGVTAPPWASVLLNYAYSGTDSTGYSGDGNDVAITITYTPEPSTMVGVVGLAGLLARRRRR